MSEDRSQKAYETQRSGEDRRKTRRHEDAFYVRLFPEGSDLGELCELLDISEGGLGAMPPKGVEFRLKSTIRVEFPLGRSPSKIQTRCIVRGDSGEGAERRIHLQFFDDSALFRETVARAIESWASRPTADRRRPD